MFGDNLIDYILLLPLCICVTVSEVSEIKVYDNDVSDEPILPPDNNQVPPMLCTSVVYITDMRAY